MADPRAKIKEELAELTQRGLMLRSRETLVKATPEQRKKLAEQLDGGKRRSSPKEATPEVEARINEMFREPDFGPEYQAWYSPALRVIEQLAPDRYAEFRELYKPERRKEMDIETYGIADYIMGIFVSKGWDKTPLFDTHSVAMTRFGQQIAILKSVEERIDLLLNNMELTIQAAVVDNELASARGLLAAKHLRSAGVVAGVVLEGHLKRLIEDHGVAFRKKAVLSNLNDSLKAAGIYDAILWREIQHLTDIRNLCGHRNERDPEQGEVESLIDGTDKIVHTIF